MKQSIKMTLLNIAKKMKLEMRLFIDDTNTNTKFLYSQTNSETGVHNTVFAPFPNIICSIVKEAVLNEDGNYVRPPWNPNDSIIMTKMSLPVFYNELKTIYKDMSTDDLYKYHGKRLELNEKIAESIRRVFMIGTTTVELSPVVITNEGVDDKIYAEGIKLKFNNEASSVVLTLNETYGLLWNLNHLEIDAIALMMYNNFYNKGNAKSNKLKKDYPIEVDIKVPKKDPSLDMVTDEI